MTARSASSTRETTGNEVLLLEGGAQFFPELERALHAAHDHVFIETYLLNDDAATRRLAGAMAEAAARGVRVSLVVDGFGTPVLPRAIDSLLRAAGVLVEIFRPELNLAALTRRRLRRLHRKMAVIDAQVAFVGGINLIDDRFDPAEGKLDMPRLDYAVRVRGPLVAHVLQAAQTLWRELTGRRSRRGGAAQGGVSAAGEPPAGRMPSGPAPEFALSHPDAHGPVRAMLVLRDNLRFRRSIEREYLRAIGRARHDIMIANAYFFPGARFINALVRAAARGVKVRLLLQGRVEYLLPHFGTRALYDELLLAGVEIIEYRASFLHAKVAVVDDWATVGSSNIDPFSLLLAREANVMVRDAAFARALRGRLSRAIAQGGVPVPLEHHERRSLPARLLSWAAYGAMRVGVAISGARGKY